MFCAGNNTERMRMGRVARVNETLVDESSPHACNRGTAFLLIQDLCLWWISMYQTRFILAVNKSSLLGHQYHLHVWIILLTLIWQKVKLGRELEFRYYSCDKNYFGSFSSIGESSTLQPFNCIEPTYIHLSYSDWIDQIHISYFTEFIEIFSTIWIWIMSSTT